MSAPSRGPFPAPGSAWPPPDPRTINQYPRPKFGRTITAALIAAVVVGVAVTVIATLALTGGDDDAVDAPDEWDARVVEVIDVIEEIRGLEFEHPIAVTFLAEDDFVERVTTENDGATDEEIAQMEQTVELLRALGLVEGEVDLLEANDRLAADGVLGFYDTATTELVVRGDGEALDPMVMATVVHELTHALQDQHFDLDAALSGETSGAATAGRSLIEADANFVEQRWIARLSTEEQAEYQRLLRDFVSRGGDGADGDGPPAVLAETLSFPYVFGPVLHAALRDSDGLAAVDNAFESYPASEEQILFPRAYLDGDEPLAVEVPGEPDGDVVEDGDFGAFGLFQVLARRLDYEPALTAAEGWGGDAYRIVDRDGTTCVDLAVRGDSDDDLDELVAAFEQWVDDLDSASVEVVDERVVLSSCDPGDSLPPSSHRTETGDAFAVLTYRAAIQNQAMTIGGVDLETATCVGDAFVAEVGVDRLGEINDELNDDPEAQLPAEAMQAVAAAMAAC